MLLSCNLNWGCQNGDILNSVCSLQTKVSLKPSGSFLGFDSVIQNLTLTEASTLLLYAKGATQAANGLCAHHCIAGLSFHTQLFLCSPC